MIGAHHNGWRVPASIVVCAAVACGAEPDTRPARIDTLTDGVPSLVVEDTLTIGAIDGPRDYLFTSIAGAVERADGSIVVAERVGQELRIFNERGEHTLTVGREGSGPNEFTVLDAIYRLPGDTVLAVDVGRQGLTVLVQSSLNGAPWPLPLPSDRFHIVGALSTRHVLTWDSPRHHYEEGVLLLGGDEPMPVTLVDLSIGARDSISAASHGVEVRARYGGARVAVPLPFGHESFVLAGAGRVAVVDGRSGEASFFGPDGALGARARPEYSPRPVTSRERAGFFEQTERFDAPQIQRIYRDIRGGVQLPEYQPNAIDAHMDPYGILWLLELGGVTSDTARWRMVDLKGTIRTSVEVPLRFDRVLDIGYSRLLLERTGPGGVPQVVAVRIRRDVDSEELSSNR